MQTNNTCDLLTCMWECNNAQAFVLKLAYMSNATDVTQAASLMYAHNKEYIISLHVHLIPYIVGR